MENPIKMDDLGIPLFLETPMYTTFVFQLCFITWARALNIGENSGFGLVSFGFPSL